MELMTDLLKQKWMKDSMNCDFLLVDNSTSWYRHVVSALLSELNDFTRALQDSLFRRSYAVL
jgi:hypothetical protein